MGYNKSLTSFFCIWICNFPSTICWNKFLLHWMVLALFFKIIWPMVYFYGLYSIPLVYVTILMPDHTVFLKKYSDFPFFKDFIYFYREGQGGRKRGRETSIYVCLSCSPYWGPGPQPSHAFWLGIEPSTVWFRDQHSIYWATPARQTTVF